MSASTAHATPPETRRLARAFVLPLALATDEWLVGGKARNLSRLIALGAPVPDGVVLTSAALDAVLHGTGLGDRPAGPEAIRSGLLTRPLPGEVDATLQEIGRTWLGRGRLAVRSSAVGEDGHGSSFAGQFDSVLGVTSLADLLEAVRRCWASFWSDRAIAYRRTRGIRPRGMGVIIQRQVDAAVAGVLFTRHPDERHGSSRLVIEYCGGLADRLVSGEVDPGRIEVSRAALAISTSIPPADGSDPDPSGRLTPPRVTELAALALGLETLLGGPQDVEWAIDGDGRIAIVQARPITTGRARPAPPAARWILWSNANVRENFPDPVSPLLYSIAARGYYSYFRNLGLAFGVSRRRIAAMERPLRGIIGVHGARMYYNLTNIHAVLRMAPFGDRLASAFNLFVGADDTTEPPLGAVAWGDRRSRFAQALEAMRIACCVARQYWFLERRLAAFERRADAMAADTTREALDDLPLAALGDRFGRFLEIRFHRWNDAAISDAAAMVTYALLQKLLERNGFTNATHTRLLKALPNVPSSRPPFELWTLARLIRSDDNLGRLFGGATSSVDILTAVRREPAFAAFRRAFEAYLDTWGFRSSRELMLTAPTLDECPEPVIDLLRQYAAADAEPPETTRMRQVAERRRETRQVIGAMAKRAPLQALAALVLVRWTQRSVACRERARLKQALLYTRCRRVALRIGRELVRRRQLSRPDDVFMLTFQELEEIAGGRMMFPDALASLVDLREREHCALSRLAPPDTIRLPETAVFSAADPPLTAVDPTPAAPASPMLGTSACGGRVSAPAAVLEDVRDVHRLSRGDVLVTRQTDPGWAPVFCLIAGLVIERGGMLSHGAILAREFGLPCIVGVKDATRRIPHGARIAVDGDRGTCTIEART
jgi:pyruvate,water dikinase